MLKDIMQKCYKYLWLIPISYGIIIVLIYGVNVIFWDEWAMANLYEYIEQNGFMNFSMLKIFFSQHNEHRIFFPEIILLISHKLTYSNAKISMIIIELMVTVVFVICVRYLRNSSQQDLISVCFPNTLVANLIVLLSGIACFSSIQWENFLWGFQVTFYMAIFATAGGLYYFHQYVQFHKRKYCLLSLFLGIIASFSSLHGIIVWPVIFVLVLLCLVSGKRIDVKKVIPYFLTGVACFLVYFYNWKHPSYHPDLVGNVYQIAKFLFGSIGGMYTGSYSRLTVILGGTTVLFSIGLIMIPLFQAKIKSVLFPIGLIGFSYAALLSIAIGRAGFGLGTSTSSRYMSFSVLSYLGIIMLFYQLFLTGDDSSIKDHAIKKYGKKLCSCVTILLSILLLRGNFIGLKAARFLFSTRTENVGILRNYRSEPLERLRRLYPWSTYKDAYNMIGILEKNKLNVFSNIMYSYNEVSLSRLDGFNRIDLHHMVGIGPESFAWDDRLVYFESSCWAVDYISQKEYVKIYMMINGRLHETRDHLASPDVAEYFGNPNWSNVRFFFSFPIDRLNMGENSFSAVVILNDGITYYETETIKIYYDEVDGKSISMLPKDEIMALETIFQITKPWDLSKISTHDISSIDNANGNLTLQCGTYDPYVFFQIQEPISDFQGELFAKIKYISNTSGNLQVFFDFGDGFSEENSFMTVIASSSDIKEVYCPIVNWKKETSLVFIRFDPPNGSIFELESIEIFGE